MEQTRYWTWSRRKLNERPLSSQIPPISVASSWEEQAFAEDSAGHLGGCIWPPRSYSCSFCRREFRSAQALGGHMNVHRRDRARLKQSSIPSSEPLENGHYHHLTLCMPPIRTQYPSQVGPLVYNSNPKPNPNCDVVVSPLSPSKVSATSTQQSWTEHTLISPSYSSCVIREKPKESLFSTTRSPKNSIPLGLSAIPKLNLGRESLRSREVGCQAQRDLDDEEDEAISRKRGRATDSTSFFVRPSSDDRQQVQPEVLKFNPKPVEELDLELRLGGPPRVK